MPLSRLDSLRANIDPILSGLAQGISNEAFVSELLLPTVDVESRTGQFPEFGKENMRVHDAQRALKDPLVKNVPIDDWTFQEYGLKEYGLEMSIDHLEQEAASQIANLEQFAMSQVMQSLLLTQEYERVQLLSASGSYASGHVSALTGDDCWDDSDSAPLTQIKDAISTIRTKTAQYPNTLILGLQSFNALSEHASLIEKLKYSQMAVVTEDLISAMISTKTNKINVAVGAGMYEDAITKVMTDLWGDVAVLAYVPPTKRAQRNKYESSFGYTFGMRGYPIGARDVSKYGLTTSVAAFLMFQAKITKNTAGYLWTNTKGS